MTGVVKALEWLDDHHRYTDLVRVTVALGVGGDAQVILPADEAARLAPGITRVRITMEAVA